MNNPDLDWYYDQLKDHTLEPLEIGQHVKSYYLRKTPGSRMMSSVLIFSPGGIVITGDLHPGRHDRGSGLIGAGYDLAWFSHKMEPRYLASKFLTEVWVPSAFKEGVQERIRTYIKERVVDRKRRRWRVGTYVQDNWTEERALRYLISHDELFDNPHSAYDNLPAYQRDNGLSWLCPYDYEFLSPGHDYDPVELGWLAAIQRRFSELIGALDDAK